MLGTYLGSARLVVWAGAAVSIQPEFPTAYTPRIHGIWTVIDFVLPSIYEPEARILLRWSPSPRATSRRANLLRPLTFFESIPIRYARGTRPSTRPNAREALDFIPLRWEPPPQTPVPMPPAFEGSVLGVIPSRRTSNKFYSVKRGNDGAIFCDCPGWIYSKNNPKVCRHVLAFTAMLDPDLAPAMVVPTFIRGARADARRDATFPDAVDPDASSAPEPLAPAKRKISFLD